MPASEAADLVSEVADLIPRDAAYFLLSAWLTPDFSEHGLVLIGHPPVMMRFPAPRPASAAPGVVVDEVRDAETLAVAERVLIEGYPMPGAAPGSVLRPGLLDGATRVWLGYVDGRPASVACAHQAAGATLVEYVAALPAARGRGPAPRSPGRRRWPTRRRRRCWSRATTAGRCTSGWGTSPSSAGPPGCGPRPRERHHLTGPVSPKMSGTGGPVRATSAGKSGDDRHTGSGPDSMVESRGRGLAGSRFDSHASDRPG